MTSSEMVEDRRAQWVTYLLREAWQRPAGHRLRAEQAQQVATAVVAKQVHQVSFYKAGLEWAVPVVGVAAAFTAAAVDMAIADIVPTVSAAAALASSMLHSER